MVTLFTSLVRPVLEYGCEIWCPYKIKDVIAIEKIQQNFTSKISSLSNLDYWQRLAELGLESLQRRRDKLVILHTWKIKNAIYPNTINLQFKEERRTKADRAIIRPLPKVHQGLITKFDESFIVRSARLWNKIPPNLTKLRNYNEFKIKLNQFLSKIPDKPPIPGYSFVNHNSVLDF